MIHAKATKPFIYPQNGDVAPVQIDRVQDLSGDITLSKDKVYELGRSDLLGYKVNTPSLKYTLKQFEYGSMDFWYKLANVAAPASSALDESIDLDDIKSTFFDITATLTDEDLSTTFRGTIWFPKLRVNGFSINIGDPDAIVERNFDLIGEDYKILLGKYFAYNKKNVVAPGNDATVMSPVAIEYASGDYIFKVVRIRSSVATELEEGSGTNEWSYNSGTATVTTNTCLVGDVIKFYYIASTASTVPAWTDNDTDVDYLKADSCEIYLKVGAGSDQRVYRLQSVGIDVTFERTDYKELGNATVVQTGVKSKTTKVTLGRLLEEFTLEEVEAGKDPSALDYPYIDTRNLSDDITLTVKIFTDSTHTTFKMGYKIANLTPTTISTAATVDDYGKQDNTMESDEFMATTDESEL